MESADQAVAEVSIVKCKKNLPTHMVLLLCKHHCIIENRATNKAMIRLTSINQHIQFHGKADT